MVGARKCRRRLQGYVINYNIQRFAPKTIRGEKRCKTDAVLQEYRDILIASGFSSDAADWFAPLRYCPSMAEFNIHQGFPTIGHLFNANWGLPLIGTLRLISVP
jgi:hypothetical protein